jgi:transposase
MRRLDEKRTFEVLHLLRDGMTARAIARALKISRNTVRQIVQEHERARQSPHWALAAASSGAARPSKLDR